MLSALPRVTQHQHKLSSSTVSLLFQLNYWLERATVSSAEILIGKVILQIICEWCDTPIDLAASNVLVFVIWRKKNSKEKRCKVCHTINICFSVVLWCRSKNWRTTAGRCLIPSISPSCYRMTLQLWISAAKDLCDVNTYTWTHSHKHIYAHNLTSLGGKKQFPVLRWRDIFGLSIQCSVLPEAQ